MRHACILTVLLVLAPAARADPHAALTALEQSEPSRREVRMAALRDAGLETRPEASWSRRSRLTGLMPVVPLTAAHDTGTDHGVSRSSSGTERLDMGTDEDFGFQARAVWQLDRLLYSIITEDWKLIHRDTAEAESELFQLSVDPQERANRHGTEPALAAELRRRLDELEPYRRTPFEEAMDEEALERLRSLGYVGGDGR